MFFASAFAGNKTGRDYILFPEPTEVWSYNSALGLNLTILPLAIGEEEIRQIPLIYYKFRLGLPLNFSANAELSTNVISNQVSLGLQWSLPIGSLSISAGDNAAFWYGFANIEGFDLTAWGALNYPFISVGYDLKDMYISFRTEMIIVNSRETNIGGTTVDSRKTQFAGYTFLGALETSLWNKNDVMLAFGLNYTNSLTTSWLAFSTFENRLAYPQFLLGFVF